MKKILAAVIAIILSLCIISCGKPDEATQLVIDEITDLENSDYITLAGIAKAKERYNSLSDRQKEKVTNYASLMRMEDNYEELGQIPLGNNLDEFLDIRGRYYLSDEKGNEYSKYGKAYYLTGVITSKKRSDVVDCRFYDVIVTVETRVTYLPIGDDTKVDTMTDISSCKVVCDESGYGEGKCTIECTEGRFYEQAIMDVEYIVTDISGTVLPLE